MLDLAKYRTWSMVVAVVFSTATGCTAQQHHLQDDPTSALVAPAFATASGPRSTFHTTANHATAPANENDTLGSREVVPVVYQASPSSGPVEEKLPAPTPLEHPDRGIPNSSKGVTLDQVINATLLADPRLRAGFEAINQANADALTASLKPNPELFADIQLLPLTRPFTEERQGGPPQQDVFMRWPIDWFLFGKRAAEMQAAGLGVRVSQAEYADLVRQRVLEAAIAYYDVLEAKALVELAQQDLENFVRVEELTRKAVEGGGRPRVELDRVRLDRLRSEQNLRDANNNLVAATAALRAVMGRADSDPHFEVSGTLEGIVPNVPLTPDEAFTVALDNRPDIDALRWKVRQSHAEALSERRKAFPTVTPGVGYTRQYQTKAIGMPDANSYNIECTMSLPIYDRNQGNRAKAASVITQVNYELDAALVALRAEVAQVDQEFRTAAANSRAVAGEQLKLAEQVRDSINKAYEAGGRPLIDVLDAQRNYRETYRLFIESRANLGRAEARYHALLGRKVTP